MQASDIMTVSVVIEMATRWLMEATLDKKKIQGPGSGEGEGQIRTAWDHTTQNNLKFISKIYHLIFSDCGQWQIPVENKTKDERGLL